MFFFLFSTFTISATNCTLYGSIMLVLFYVGTIVNDVRDKYEAGK